MTRGYTNKTFEPTFNPKKHSADRRKRPIRKEGEIPSGNWLKGKHVFPPNPKGHNRAALRGMLAKDKMRKIDYPN